jgi:hypothetical protein
LFGAVAAYGRTERFEDGDLWHSPARCVPSILLSTSARSRLAPCASHHARN